jgi:hypothetical protein
MSPRGHSIPFLFFRLSLIARRNNRPGQIVPVDLNAEWRDNQRALSTGIAI